jgi:hypothetical protein
VAGCGPVMVAGPFTHNSSLCDTALGYAPGSQVVPAVALGLPAGGGRMLSGFTNQYYPAFANYI